MKAGTAPGGGGDSYGLYTYVTNGQFFLIMAACAFASVVVCFFWLKEPHGGFAEEYQMSSVDLELERERKAA